MAGLNSGVRIPTTADLMSMWNASGLKEKLIFTFFCRTYNNRRMAAPRLH